jgi:uncharacterized coiled-coil protein SlyX
MVYETGDIDMVLKPGKDKALEALDFVISVLGEYEKDMDRLTNQLSEITERFKGTDEISAKIEKIEDQLTSLQNEIRNMISSNTSLNISHSPFNQPNVTVECRQWEEFKHLAAGAEKLSHVFTEKEKFFQARALEKNRIYIYTGEFPQKIALLKLWLSKELNVIEPNVIEGHLI